jgi:hypothetical protein
MDQMEVAAYPMWPKGVARPPQQFFKIIIIIIIIIMEQINFKIYIYIYIYIYINIFFFDIFTQEGERRFKLVTSAL